MLTGREHLELYARIKGIAEEDISKVVNSKIVEMDLSEYADRAANTYSGGNKRKLSVAIAMIGEPSIVFLDGKLFDPTQSYELHSSKLVYNYHVLTILLEPSTGMDPVARRFMWKIITDIVTKREKCSLILTTHSMEECEALCTRIGIMVGGVLRCLGSSQRLRTNYGHGYQIEIGMSIPSSEAQQAKVDSIFGVLRVSPANADHCISSTNTMNNVFDALGKPQWKDRLTATGSAAELIAMLPNLTVKNFAGNIRTN